MTHQEDLDRVKHTLYERKYGVVDRVDTLEKQFDTEMKIIKNETRHMRVSMYVIIGFLFEMSILLVTIALKGVK